MFRLCLLPLLFLLLVFQTPSSGSHGMGGEVAWTCQGNGTFKFRLRFYRDCNGITPSNNLILQTNHPVGTIPLTLIQQTDISPIGYKANGDTLCPVCAQGNFFTPIPGLVEEYVYESGDVTLTGVPPSTGWWFRWGECCRSSALTNILGGGGTGFGFRAYMYPFNNQYTFPCYDNSPYFSESPSTVVCAGLPFRYNPQAIDPDGETLTFSWAPPIEDSGTLISFAPGYSVNSQLPGTAQNAANTPAVLDSLTGTITAISFTSGYFVTVMKATSYRCGVKVSEIFRDFPVTILAGCAPLASGPNNPPVVTPPFIDPTTGLQTAFTDTVNPGDTVSFQIAASDLDLFLNNNPQMLTLTGSGSMFGTNFTDPQNGCSNPPCATLSQSLPYSAQQSITVNFNWVTDCGHISNGSSTCAQIQNVFPFRFTVLDNYCPENSRETFMIKVVIRGASFTIPASQTNFCVTDPPLTLTAIPPGGTFWGVITAPNQFDPSIAGPGVHMVYYTVTDSTGCTTTDAIAMHVDACTGLDEIIDELRIHVSPVPTNEELQVQWPSETDVSLLILTDLQGRIIKTLKPEVGTSMKFSVSDISPGLYFLSAQGGGAVSGARVLIQ